MSGQKRKEAEITPKQARFITALLTCPTAEAAATAAGITSRTGRRYLKDPNVCRALTEAQSAALSDLARRLLALGNDAAGVLSEVMGSDAAPGVRVRAADVSLSKLLQVKELAEIESRITALEARISEVNNESKQVEEGW